MVAELVQGPDACKVPDGSAGDEGRKLLLMQDDCETLHSAPQLHAGFAPSIEPFEFADQIRSSASVGNHDRGSPLLVDEPEQFRGCAKAHPTISRVTFKQTTDTFGSRFLSPYSRSKKRRKPSGARRSEPSELASRLTVACSA